MKTKKRTRLAPATRKAMLLHKGVKFISKHEGINFNSVAFAKYAKLSRGLIHYYFGTSLSFKKAITKYAKTLKSTL